MELVQEFSEWFMNQKDQLTTSNIIACDCEKTKLFIDKLQKMEKPKRQSPFVIEYVENKIQNYYSTKLENEQLIIEFDDPKVYENKALTIKTSYQFCVNSSLVLFYAAANEDYCVKLGAIDFSDNGPLCVEVFMHKPQNKVVVDFFLVDANKNASVNLGLVKINPAKKENQLGHWIWKGKVEDYKSNEIQIHANNYVLYSKKKDVGKNYVSTDISNIDSSDDFLSFVAFNNSHSFVFSRIESFKEAKNVLNGHMSNCKNYKEYKKYCETIEKDCALEKKLKSKIKNCQEFNKLPPQEQELLQIKLLALDKIPTNGELKSFISNPELLKEKKCTLKSKTENAKKRIYEILKSSSYDSNNKKIKRSPSYDGNNGKL